MRAATIGQLCVEIAWKLWDWICMSGMGGGGLETEIAFLMQFTHEQSSKGIHSQL
jgi:hypothetical protein